MWFRFRIWLLKMILRSLASSYPHRNIMPQIYMLVYDSYHHAVINRYNLDSYSDFNVKSHLSLCNSELNTYFQQSLWKFK
jgi:hypothetical protein